MTIALNNLIILFLIALIAIYHANLIRNNKPIYHGWWGAGFAAFIFLYSLLFPGWWLYFIMFVVLRGWTYSPILNYSRGKAMDYWSLTSTSIIDKIERKLFKKFWIARVVYFGIWLLTIIVYVFTY